MPFLRGFTAAAALSAVAVPLCLADQALPTADQLVLELLRQARHDTALLPNSALTKPECARSLDQKLAVVENHVEEGRLENALNKLESDILPRLDPLWARPGTLCVSDQAAQERLKDSAGTAHALLELGVRNTRRRTITPESGGRIELDDGTELVIPSGAVAEQVEITVTSGRFGGSLDQGGVAWVELGPSGLEFNSPAVLSVPINLGPGADPAEIEAHMFSSHPDPIFLESELQFSESVQILWDEAESGKIEMLIDHFTIIVVVNRPSLLVVPHLPLRSLAPGDILFSLPGGSSLPGHVGLYSWASREDRLSSLVIESTTVALVPRCLPRWYGVVERELAYSFAPPVSLYLGARRPARTILTPEIRDRILAFARAQLGECYSAIGFPMLDAIDLGNDWSCAELVTVALAVAGVQEMYPYLVLPIILPRTLYEHTARVDSVAVAVGEAIEIPVEVLSSNLFDPVYSVNPANTSLVPSGFDLYYFDASSRHLVLAPEARHACQTGDIRLDASSVQGRTANFLLHVKVNDFVVSDRGPVGAISDTRPVVAAQASSACEVALASARLLLDGKEVDKFEADANPRTSVSLAFTPPAALEPGSHRVEVEIVDQDGTRSQTAWRFEIYMTHTLSVAIRGAGDGRLTTSPPGIDCPPVCSHEFPAGSHVQINAHSAPEVTVVEWSGDCGGTYVSAAGIEMSGPKSCAATFGCALPKVQWWLQPVGFGCDTTSTSVSWQVIACWGARVSVTVDVIYKDGNSETFEINEGGSVPEDCSLLQNHWNCVVETSLNFGRNVDDVSYRALLSDANGNLVREVPEFLSCDY